MPTVEQLLQRLASDDPVAVRQAAIDLADMGGVEAVPQLLRLLALADPISLNSVAYVLGVLHVQEAKPQLIALLRDPKTGGRRGCRGNLIYALMGLDCRDDYDAVVEFLLDDVCEVRIKAAIILQEIVPSQPTETLTASREALLDRIVTAYPGEEVEDSVRDFLEFLDDEIDGRSEFE